MKPGIRNDTSHTTPIPVRVNGQTDQRTTKRDDTELSGFVRPRDRTQDYYKTASCEEGEDGEFTKFIRKRTKRFYVGGFLKSVDESIIGSYIERRGIKVSLITIFRPQRSECAVIRVNVEANRSDELTVNGFWPRDVICKPWMSKAARHKSGDIVPSHRRDYDRSDWEGATSDY